MKRPMFVVLLLAAVVLLVPALALVGCTDLSGKGEEPETTATVLASTTTTQPQETTSSIVATTQPTVTPQTGGYTTSRYEETDSHLVWAGSWTFTGGADDSGGSCRYTEDAGSSVTVKFLGTRITFIAATGLAVGQARLTLDSGTPFLVDCYSATPAYQQEVWSSGDLASGTHYLKVECAGTANPASGGTGIYVDAFDVTGTLE